MVVSAFRQNRSTPQAKRSKWTRAAAILAAVTATSAGTMILASPAHADEWLGGVHYTYNLTGVDEKTAWDRFTIGPDETGLNALLGDCKAMGGSVIHKAGSGTFSDLRDRNWRIIFDFSCYKAVAPDPQGKLAAALNFQRLVQAGINSGDITGGKTHELPDLANNLILGINNGGDVTGTISDGKRYVADGVAHGEITQNYYGQLNAALAAVSSA